MDNRTLATPRSTQDGGNLTGCGINRHLLQRRYARVIRERDLLEAGMAPGPSHLLGLGVFCHWGLRVQHLKEALSGGDRPRQAIDDARELAYWEGELVHIQDKLRQAASRQMAMHDLPAAKPQDQA